MTNYKVRCLDENTLWKESRNQRKTCNSGIISNINPAWTGVGSNPCVCMSFRNVLHHEYFRLFTQKSKVYS